MHVAEIPGRSATVLSDVVILLLCFELHTDARACARAAEIPGIDPGSSVLLLNGSTSSFSRTRARAPRKSRA